MRSKQSLARMAEAARPDGYQDGTQRRVDRAAAERDRCSPARVMAGIGVSGP